MKLVLILLVITGLQVTARPSEAQNVTLSEHNISLKKVFKKIRKQTGYQFFYNDELLKTSRPVDIHVENTSLKEVLEDCFKDQPLSYGMVGKVIVVKESVKGKATGSRIKIEQIQLEGTVVDSATEAPLVGVTIRVKNSDMGTTTNEKGHFSLDVPEGTVLEVSYLGYTSKTISVSGRSHIRISLASTSTGLNQLVVVGYGTQKKVNVTGAISTISSEDISKRAVNNSIQALQGLAPNLNVSVNSSGGEPDATMNLNIRGVGSLSSSSPLILIDGVRATQAEFAQLNSNDIQDISVLKDAASAAIYGSQAAYGVILVTTKRGIKNKKVQITLSANLRLKKQIFVPPSVNSLEFAKVANVASQNFSGQDVVSKEQLEKIESAIKNHDKYGTTADPNNPSQWLGIGAGASNDWYSGFANTNWYKVMYKNTELTQKYNISLRGGGEKVSYYLSGAYFKDPGFFRYGDNNDNFGRLNFNSSVSANITKWLTISNITRFYQVDDVFPADEEMGSRGRLFHDIMRWVPMAPYKTPAVKDDQGNIIVPEQLVGMAGMNAKNGFNKYQTDNLVSTIKAEIKLASGLTLKGDYTFKKEQYRRTLNFKKWTVMGPTGEPEVVYQGNNNQIRKDWRATDYNSFNIYADYLKSFSDHNIHLLLGYQQEDNHYEQLLGGRQDVIDNELNSVNVAVGDIIGPDNPISSWATMGTFGRLSYNYKEKYLVEFNGRYDGSSKFVKGHRFGFFPSVSVGYNIYKEPFWKPIHTIINTLKIRASYGKLGNQNISRKQGGQDVPGNLYQEAIPIDIQLPWAIGGERPVYTTMPSIISPNVTWETSFTKNIGFDISFLKNRLSASVDIYQRKTDNMFGPIAAIPAVLGTSPPETNSASLKTKGWELVVGWRDHSNKFHYNVRFMLSDNRSFIIQYNNPDKVLSDWYIGEEIGEIWGFKANELFQSESEVKKYTSLVDLSYFGTGWQPGDVKYLDLNGDGKVNVGNDTRNDPGDQIIIGNDHPRYRISFQAAASWKNFSLSMLWSGIGKRDIMLDNYATLFWGWNRKAHSHITKASLDYWSTDNPNGYLPIPLNNNGRAGFGKDRYPSTRYLQNGAYIRLKNLNIGYTLPSALTNKMHISNIRVYISGENLLTFTKMWPTLDPALAATGSTSRTSDGRDYPLSQAYTFGFDVTF